MDIWEESYLKEKEEKRKLWEECQRKISEDPRHDYTYLSDYINNTCHW